MDTMFFDHNIENDGMFDELMGFLGSAKDPNLVRMYTLKFKEKGNSYYGQKDFVNAIICYAKASDIFSIAFSLEIEDERLFRELAVQLNLNLAACSLKLHDNEDAMNYCSLVLKIDPLNVKPFFRRAMALVNLGRLLEAHSDLIMALKFEPENKEIKLELASVEESLKSSQSQNRPKGLAGASVLRVCKKRKNCEQQFSLEDTLHRPLKTEVVTRLDHTLECNQGAIVSNLTESDSTSISSNSICEMSDQGGPSCLCPDNCLELPVVSDKEIAESPYRFVNRPRKDFSLKISAVQYNQLLGGKEACFYHPVLKTVLKVRVLRTKSKVPEESEWSSVSNGESVKENFQDGEVRDTIPHFEQASSIKADCKVVDCMNEDQVTLKDGDHRNGNNQCYSMSHETLFMFSSQPKTRKSFSASAAIGLSPPLHGKRFRNQQGMTKILSSERSFISNNSCPCRYHCGRKRKQSPTTLDQYTTHSKKKKALSSFHINNMMSCCLSVVEGTHSCS